MDRTKVESSNVRAIGYEDGTLEVEFSTGAIYRYAGVPAEIHGQLMRAESKGRFLRTNIRDFYAAQKMKDETPQED